jgi:hypothetical protein
LGGIFSAPGHATGTTINLTIDCTVNTTARDQYVTDGYTLIYTIKNCTSAKLAADLNTAKNAARDAYFATIAKINLGHSATLDALSAVKGTGADRVAARAALLAKIQADTKAAKAKAAADRTAAIAAATKAYAKALTATKTAVILSSN